MNRLIGRVLVVAVTHFSITASVAAKVGDVFDVNKGLHHPMPLSIPAVPGTEVEGNPAQDNPWV